MHSMTDSGNCEVMLADTLVAEGDDLSLFSVPRLARNIILKLFMSDKAFLVAL